ncbi:hypothetical protein NP233_g13027 [Leucocoprinus birnbaumii]|uniref:Uncharacterized protein n=1 Tax=Leucocoprinus birnbaumii TaxID=56174 RepID=A0AAD5VDM3_9AGAR|nr:hypothetical protein NP233_g13027 [Leucocoprinus birnbaumii]
MLFPNEIPTRPFETISVDLITDLPDSLGYDAILMVVDRFSKRLYAIPCHKSLDSLGAARLFRDHVWRHEGFPSRVISDRGAQFASAFTKELHRSLGTKANISSSHHPQTDGQTERMNQEIEQYFRVFVNYHMDDWAEWLPIAEFSYNNKASTATKRSPFFITKGFEVNSSLGPTRGGERAESADEFVERMRKVREDTAAALRQAADDMQRFYNEKRRADEFVVGDKVWLEGEHIVTGRPKKKLDWRRFGPFTIIQKISPVAYKLRLPPSWRMHPVFHISRLRRFHADSFERPNPRVTLNVRGENWEPERVLDSRVVRGRTEFLVKWKDQSSERDTWETEARVRSEAPHLIMEYRRRCRVRPEVEARSEDSP